MIKAVVFDADGMVLPLGLFSVRLAKEHCVPERMTRPFFEKEFKECTIGKRDLKAELRKRLKQWKWNGSVEGLLRYWFEADVVDCRVAEVVKALREKGVKCCLATNQEKYRAAYLSKEKGLANVFDELFFSCDLGCRKPEARFFEKMLEKMRLKKEEVLLWDDKPEFVEKAREYGLSAELYRDFEGFRARLNTFSTTGQDNHGF